METLKYAFLMFLISIMSLCFALALACGDDDDVDYDSIGDDSEHENQTPDENSNPGGCGDEPVPTYANEMCDHSEYASEGYHTFDFTWCCLNGEYIDETWTLGDDGCWELDNTYSSDGICN
jgi:hypothetical protein